MSGPPEKIDGGRSNATPSPETDAVNSRPETEQLQNQTNVMPPDEAARHEDPPPAIPKTIGVLRRTKWPEALKAGTDIIQAVLWCWAASIGRLWIHLYSSTAVSDISACEREIAS
jgi:hypothetical protein